MRGKVRCRHYDELDVKTHVLMAINGLNTLKGFVK